MANDVTNRLIFCASKSDEVFNETCPNGKFNFETLIPTPLHVYLGPLSSHDEKDFPINWHSWNRSNWGTKWNCYNQSLGTIVDNVSIGPKKNLAFIQFDTAWSVPYPIITAFANKFNIPFEHHYCDQFENFWGIEIWGFRNDEDGQMCRLKMRKNDVDDIAELRLLLALQ